MVKVKSHTRRVNGKEVHIKEHDRKDTEDCSCNATEFLIKQRAEKYKDYDSIDGGRSFARGRTTRDREGVVLAFVRREGGVKTSNDSLATDDTGRVLYSYNTPIAYNSRDGTTFVNSDKYSPTTSTQQNLVRKEAGNVKEVSAKELHQILNAEKIRHTEGRLMY